MDIMRSCYVVPMRFVPGAATVLVKWYRVNDSAKVFEADHSFMSLNWEDDPMIPGIIGEDRTVARPVWSNGAKIGPMKGNNCCAYPQKLFLNPGMPSPFSPPYPELSGIPQPCGKPGPSCSDPPPYSSPLTGIVIAAQGVYAWLVGTVFPLSNAFGWEWVGTAGIPPRFFGEAGTIHVETVCNPDLLHPGWNEIDFTVSVPNGFGGYGSPVTQAVQKYFDRPYPPFFAESIYSDGHGNGWTIGFSG